MYQMRAHRVPAASDTAPGVIPFEAFGVWLDFNGGKCEIVTRNNDAAFRVFTPDGSVIAETGDVVAFDNTGRPRVYREVLPAGGSQ
jgi:hypothetical protein